jgi:polysaccharide export outer membrane protein
MTEWTGKCHEDRHGPSPDQSTQRNFEDNMRLTTNWNTPLLTIVIIAGAALIAKAADIPKTVPAANSASDYRLGPEDVIEVFVWKEPDLSTTVVIRPDGKISLPLANELDASGKTAVQLQQEIVEKLRQFVVQPMVNVMVKQINSLKISILGEVRKPDVYRIKNRVTVLDAIAMAGGFTDLARPNRVIVLRNSPSGPQRIKINVKQAVSSDTNAPFFLQSQDTVYVEGR